MDKNIHDGNSSLLFLEIAVQQPHPHLFMRMKHDLLTMNLFPSIPPSTDEEKLRTQRISTRLFIFSFVISLAVLIGYNSLVDVVMIREVNAPNLTQYLQLYSKYSQTLTCPCRKISVRYDRFLRVNYTLHQVCSSAFVSDDWIAFLPSKLERGSYFLNDFRMVSSSIFETMKILCLLSNQTIFDSLSRFYSNDYVALSVTSQQLFQSQSQLWLNEFISSTLIAYLSTLQTIIRTIKSNNLFSLVSSQYVFMKEPKTGAIVKHEVSYGGCYCSVENCIINTTIYDYPNATIVFSTPGLYMGCSMVESLLESTLECFYNQTCIDTLESYVTKSSPMNVSALDKSLIGRFPINATMQKIVDQLMVETWNIFIMYQSYYKECKPMKCTYTYVTKHSVIYVATTIFGLIGGLVTILMLVIPELVKFRIRFAMIVRRCIRCQRIENGKYTSKMSFKWIIRKRTRVINSLQWS